MTFLKWGYAVILSSMIQLNFPNGGISLTQSSEQASAESQKSEGVVLSQEERSTQEDLQGVEEKVRLIQILQRFV